MLVLRALAFQEPSHVETELLCLDLFGQDFGPFLYREPVLASENTDWRRSLLLRTLSLVSKHTYINSYCDGGKGIHYDTTKKSDTLSSLTHHLRNTILPPQKNTLQTSSSTNQATNYYTFELTSLTSKCSLFEALTPCSSNLILARLASLSGSPTMPSESS